jgi:multiple sugar transport system permease protein
VLIAVGLLMIYPLLWMIFASLKPDEMIFQSPGLIPRDAAGNLSFHFGNYIEGWTMQSGNFGRYMANSFLIVAASVVGNLLTCSMAAYGFARLRWRGRDLAFALMLLTMMLPAFVMVVPQYIMWSKLGLIGTFAPLIIPKFLAVDAFFVFMMVQFFRGLPRELDEAAMIDGASYWTIYWRVLVPLSVPAFATAAIFTFIWVWNDFFNQLLYLDRDTMTASVALSNFVDATSKSQWGELFAMSVVTVLPVFLVFLFGQRYLVKGIATTGLK